MKPGKKNLITDITGIKIGNAEDHSIKTGVTVLTSDNPFTAGISVMGGRARNKGNRPFSTRQDGTRD